MRVRSRIFPTILALLLVCARHAGAQLSVPGGGGGGSSDGDAFTTLSNGSSALSASGAATLEVTGAELSGTDPVVVTIPHSLVACRTPIDDDNNTTTATQTLLTCTIPANTLTANNCLVLTSLGSMQQNGGGSLTMTVTYGAGTLANVNSNAISTLRMYNFTAQICGNTATNSQDVLSHLQALSSGVGALGTMAIDATVAQTLTFTIAFTTSAATNIFNQKWGGVRVE